MVSVEKREERGDIRRGRRQRHSRRGKRGQAMRDGNKPGDALAGHTNISLDPTRFFLLIQPSPQDCYSAPAFPIMSKGRNGRRS